MTAAAANKRSARRAQSVAVILTPADLRKGTRARQLPDFFELRLDALYPVLPEAAGKIKKLRAPFLVTARHPLEGGWNNLDDSTRRELLLRFLPSAAYVDVELRSAARMKSVLQKAKALGIGRIISVHDLHRTPSARQLAQTARSAERFAPEIIKIATRTETEDECVRLTTFFDDTKTRAQLSVMGLGKFGRASRIALAKRGSVLNYAHLQTADVDGQLSFEELRRLLRNSRHLSDKLRRI